MVREAETEKHKMKQSLVEQQMEADMLKMSLCAGMRVSQGVAASATQEISAFKRSIAKHESAYSSVWGALVANVLGTSCSKRSPTTSSCKL